MQTDKDILSAIYSGPPHSDKAFEYLFKESGLREWTFQYVTANSGSRDDAEDTFMDSLLALHINISSSKFEKRSSIATYFKRIVENHWLMELRTRKSERLRRKEISYLQDTDTRNQDHEAEKDRERSALIQRGLKSLKKPCEDLLIFNIHEWSSLELCERFNFPSPDAAKKAVSRCKEKLRDFFRKELPHIEF